MLVVVHHKMSPNCVQKYTPCCDNKSVNGCRQLSFDAGGLFICNCLLHYIKTEAGNFDMNICYDEEKQVVIL